MFVPNLREVLLRNPLVGWVLFLCALLALAVAAAFMQTRHDRQLAVERERLEARLADLTRQSAAESDSLQQRHDEQIALLGDRQVRAELALDSQFFDELLGDWTVHGYVHTYLLEGPNYKRLPTRFADEIDSAARRWADEPRSLSDPLLRSAFEDLRNSVTEYNRDGINKHLWYDDGGRTEPASQDWLAIPAEWDWARSEAATAELSRLERRLRLALDAAFTTRHEASRRVASTV
ncbi:hypothetical protein ACWFOS_00090 [Gordonia terrae]